AGTLALMTLSCDNDLDWIEGWARFHAVNYGVDAVVLYDNASVGYGPGEIEDRLRTVPGLREIVVIDQPARFGVRQQDLTGRYNAYPDIFLQTAMFRHALERLLPLADAACNFDIDELLVLSESGSLREVLAPSAAVTRILRKEVHAAPSTIRRPRPRHADAWQELEDDAIIVWTPKWIAQPKRLPELAAAGIHVVIGASTTVCAVEEGFVAHVWELTKSLKMPERFAPPVRPSSPNLLLRARLERAFGAV
ncbi:MAG: hypothetical protein ACR2J8_05965, partial [Thermomicrobiales bacterium]